MTRSLVFAGAFATAAGAALAHPGPHAHPHDGPSWLAVVSVLTILAVAGTVAVAQVRRRK